MRKLIYIGTIALVVALGLFLWGVKQEEKKEKARVEAWEKERRPLEVKKEKLEKELSELNREYQNFTMPKATTQFLFAELDPKLYSACYPLMKKMGYTGTLILSSTQLPGMEGCISTEQFQELVNDGWDVCVQWDDGQSVSRWWPKLQAELTKLKIKVGKAVYFPKGTYRTELDKNIQQMGFSIAICEKEDQESPLQSQYEEGVWHIGAMGIMTEKPKIWLMEAIGQDSNVAFVVGFKQEHQLYNAGTFERMLKLIQEYELSGDMLVYDIEKTREYYHSRENGISAEVEAAYQTEKARLEKEIQTVKAQLKEIDAQYL